MSITSDIRAYADNAVSQGKQVLDNAQQSLNDVTGQAGDIVGRARENVNDLRASAEKAVNLDAVTTAIEPYLAQVREYTTAVSDRVEHAVEGLRSDKRVAALIDQAEALGTTVVETINERVVKPVQTLTGRGTTTTKPRPTTSRPAAKPAARKPATTRSASTKPATKSASKPAARKPAAKKTAKS